MNFIKPSRRWYQCIEVLILMFVCKQTVEADNLSVNQGDETLGTGKHIHKKVLFLAKMYCTLLSKWGSV